MPRNMSFSMTTDAVRDRTKTVTRRTGWKFLREGDLLWAVEKGMGLKKGEKAVRLALLRVVTVRRELLRKLEIVESYGEEEMRREGFPGLAPHEFVSRWYARNGLDLEVEVTRIEFEYAEKENRNDAEIPKGGH